MTLHLALLGDAHSVHLQRWAHEMLARGFRVSVVTARAKPIDGVAEQRVLPPVSRSIDWLWRVGAAGRALASLAPDVVHAHYITSYGYLAARVARRPLVLTAWGSDLLVTPKNNVLMRILTGWTLRQADLLTGDSVDLVDEIRRYRPTGSVQLVHWGADLQRFAPTPWQSKPRFDIVSLRNWEPNYRIELIVRAMAILLRERPSETAHLHLLGGGPDQASLTQLVQTLGLQKHVTLHGRLDDAGMAAVLARCKVSVSVPQSDATSVSVLESMASGLAVVASDLPANRQWLGDTPDLLLSAPDAVALARSLASLQQNDDCAHRIGQANREHMQSSGSRAVQMDRMADLYRSLATRKP
jgi:glycosyltransferase involved in cell wall biosynthesis